MDSFNPVCFLLGISIGGLLTSVQEQRASVATHLIRPAAEQAAVSQEHLIGFLPNLVNDDDHKAPADSVLQVPLLPVPEYEKQSW